MSLKVSVKNKTTLILEEEGHIGDEINLLDVTNVDTREIEARIEDKKDEIYQRKIQEAKEKFDLEKESAIDKTKNDLEKKINELNEVNKSLKKDLEIEKNKEIDKLKDDLNKEISELKAKLLVSESSLESKVKLKEAEIDKKYQERINQLQKEIEKEKATKEKDILELNSNHQEEIFKLKEQITELRNQKSVIGSKLTGEDLEIYCKNLYEEASQNGFKNCKWYKDNKAVKENGEEHGTKADFIFEIYATDECKEDNLLTNVCLEMKDENPDSTNKKKNEDYYKQLDINRNKKNCKYALLVSNLGLGASNDVPIKKINEYPDMYMVRPGYMITFLNMLVSLTNKFKDLYLKDYEEKQKIKDEIELTEEFDELKEKYLDKPLEQLNDKVNDILKQNKNIKNACEKIDEYSQWIINQYISKMNDRLNNFDIKITKAYKKKNKTKGDK